MNKKKDIHKKLIQLAKKLLPPLGGTHYKGQSGRVGVLGGSLEYTGAPYFSAIATMKTGVDLVHVICETSAATVIKGYSPDLIVHPNLTTKCKDQKEFYDNLEEIKGILSRLHSLIIGPGLSRNKYMLYIAEQVIKEAIKLDLPLVIDADGLFLIHKKPELIKGYQKVILTPNLVEFKRLCETMNISEDTEKEELCRKLSIAFQGATIIQKGSIDIISNGKQTYHCDVRGGDKRSGGQGDLLSGILGTFIAWEALYYKQENQNQKEIPKEDRDHFYLAGCYASCTIIRSCSSTAYNKHLRSTQASDMIPEISNIFQDLFLKKLD